VRVALFAFLSTNSTLEFLWWLLKRDWQFYIIFLNTVTSCFVDNKLSTTFFASNSKYIGLRLSSGTHFKADNKPKAYPIWTSHNGLIHSVLAKTKAHVSSLIYKYLSQPCLSAWKKGVSIAFKLTYNWFLSLWISNGVLHPWRLLLIGFSCSPIS